MQHVERMLSGKELAPQVEREQLFCATQYWDKVCLEGLDCFLCNVLATVMRWDQLEGHVVLLDGVLEFQRAIVIVGDMPLGFNSCFFEVVYQVLVGTNHFAGCAIFHRFDQDFAAVEFNQHHHILVAEA